MHECMETVLEIHTNPARIIAIPPDWRRLDIQSSTFMIDGRGALALWSSSLIRLPCLALQRLHRRPYDNIFINHLSESLSYEQGEGVEEEG